MDEHDGDEPQVPFVGAGPMAITALVEPEDVMPAFEAVTRTQLELAWLARDLGVITGPPHVPGQYEAVSGAVTRLRVDFDDFQTSVETLKKRITLLFACIDEARREGEQFRDLLKQAITSSEDPEEAYSRVRELMEDRNRRASEGKLIAKDGLTDEPAAPEAG